MTQELPLIICLHGADVVELIKCVFVLCKIVHCMTYMKWEHKIPSIHIMYVVLVYSGIYVYDLSAQWVVSAVGQFRAAGQSGLDGLQYLRSVSVSGGGSRRRSNSG